MRIEKGKDWIGRGARWRGRQRDCGAPGDEPAAVERKRRRVETAGIGVLFSQLT
jgi:hypothetical protein